MRWKEFRVYVGDDFCALLVLVDLQNRGRSQKHQSNNPENLPQSCAASWTGANSWLWLW